MKTFCYWESLNVPAYILNSNIDGVTLVLQASQLVGIGGAFNFSFMPALKDCIKKIGAKGKGVTLSFEGGDNWGNGITNVYPSIDFVRKKGQNPMYPSQQIKVPVPFNPGYIQKVTEIIIQLSIELKKDASVYSVIENIKVFAVTEITSELRFTGADFTNNINNINTAYVQGATKWINAGYTCEKAVECCTGFIKLFSDCFPDKIIIQSYIPKLNSFPTIDKQGLICSDKSRPDLKEEVILIGQLLSNNFRAQFTAFELNAKVPVHSKYIQLNRGKLGHGKQTLEEYISVIDQAIAGGYEYLEIFSPNILSYPSLYQ